MRTRNLLFLFALLAIGALNTVAQTLGPDLEFTTSGTCAKYVTLNNRFSHQSDSVYMINKTRNPIVVDALMEDAWNSAVPAVIAKGLHEQAAGSVLDVTRFPATDSTCKGTFRALWTDNGVYMFFHVVDKYVRYQNP